MQLTLENLFWQRQRFGVEEALQLGCAGGCRRVNVVRVLQRGRGQEGCDRTVYESAPNCRFVREEDLIGE